MWQSRCRLFTEQLEGGSCTLNHRLSSTVDSGIVARWCPKFCVTDGFQHECVRILLHRGLIVSGIEQDFLALLFLVEINTSNKCTLWCCKGLCNQLRWIVSNIKYMLSSQAFRFSFVVNCYILLREWPSLKVQCS